MEMSSAQWLSAMGMEDPVLARQCSNMSPITGEQLGKMVQLPNKNSNSMGSISSYIPVENHNNSQMATSGVNLGVRSSESLTGYERPLKIPKTYNSYSNSSQSPFSSVYLANPPQKFETMEQHCLPQQLESYITSLPQLKDEIYEAVAPRTPNMQGEIIFSQGYATNENCIFDINHCVDAVSSFGGRESLSTGNIIMGAANSMKNSIVPAKTPGQAHDHIMAERKRRERLSQRFIALSAIIPGLKKMDKASVLDDTIKYVKKLQERLNVLEQQTAKNTLQSVVYVNKSSSCSRPAKMKSEETASDPTPMVTPEIEARLVDKSVLIRIHCEKKKGLLVKFLAELEKLQLLVVNASILSFSETTLDLTLSAQVEEGCALTVTNIVKSLEAIFKITN